MATQKTNTQQKTVETVITATNVPDFSKMTPQEIVDYGLSKMTTVEAVKTLDERKAGKATEISAEVAQLQKRNAEIDEAIKLATADLREEKARNITRLAELNVKVQQEAKEKNARAERLPCPECNAARQTEKNANCITHNAWKSEQEADKASGKLPKTFSQYLIANGKASPSQV